MQFILNYVFTIVAIGFTLLMVLGLALPGSVARRVLDAMGAVVLRVVDVVRVK